MSEHNPNNSPPLRVVYSPLGEKFEVSPANFYDLTRNANWTEQKPHPDTVRDYCERNGVEVPADSGEESTAAPTSTPEPAPAPAETPAETPAAEAPAETPAETPAAEEQNASGEAPEEVQEADEAAAVKTVPSDFADMDKDAVKAYIDETFPGTEIDGRKGRDALVAQALELAAARNA
jgi:hypothetical protein